MNAINTTQIQKQLHHHIYDMYGRDLIYKVWPDWKGSEKTSASAIQDSDGARL